MVGVFESWGAVPGTQPHTPCRRSPAHLRPRPVCRRRAHSQLLPAAGLHQAVSQTSKGHHCVKAAVIELGNSRRLGCRLKHLTSPRFSVSVYKFGSIICLPRPRQPGGAEGSWGLPGSTRLPTGLGFSLRLRELGRRSGREREGTARAERVATVSFDSLHS